MDFYDIYSYDVMNNDNVGQFISDKTKNDIYIAMYFIGRLLVTCLLHYLDNIVVYNSFIIILFCKKIMVILDNIIYKLKNNNSLIKYTISMLESCEDRMYVPFHVTQQDNFSEQDAVSEHNDVSEQDSEQDFEQDKFTESEQDNIQEKCCKKSDCSPIIN